MLGPILTVCLGQDKLRRLIRRRLKRLMWVVALAMVIVAVMLYFSLRDIPSVLIVNNRYPVVHFLGTGIPPSIEWVKSRPASWVSLSEIPPTVVGGIVVSEDWAFYRHHGFDLHQIKEAVVADWKAKRFVRGASTITQQTARNLFLDKDKTLWRKLKELVLTLSMERRLKKKKILELYVNIAEWDRGLYGIGPASWHYFQKGVSALSPKEGAFLAMLLPSPRRYSLSYYRGKLTPHAEKTVSTILEKMAQAGYLTPEEADVAAHFPLPFEQTIERITPESEPGEAPPPEDEL
jgi:monofunctional glycosyltransferase